MVLKTQGITGASIKNDCADLIFYKASSCTFYLLKKVVSLNLLPVLGLASCTVLV